MKLTLPARLALLWAVLSSALIAGLGWLLWRGTREHELDTRRESLRHGAKLVQVKLQTAMEDVIRDVQYLTGTFAVREFAKAPPDSRGPQQTAVEQDFTALLRGKSYYSQVRLIAIDGMELVRVDNTDTGPKTTPQGQLQNKADRDYFQRTVRLQPGEAYLSEMNLNQEFGKIAVPWVPTVRAGAILAGTSGGQGVLIINVDLRSLLQELARLPETGVTLRVANGQGDYLIHPDPEALFGSDLGQPARFRPGEPQERDSLAHEEVFPLHDQSGRTAAVRLRLPSSELLTGLRAARNQAVLITVAASLGGALLVALTVRRAVAKIETARRTAEEAARVREDFIAQMSHEIRTPMNAVTGLLEVLDRNRPAPHQQPVLRSLRAAARNLMGLLNDALDWSKIRAGMMEFDSTSFDLRALLDEIVLTHRPLALQKGLTLDLDAEDDLPRRIQGDPLRLSQVLHNLLGNALKFTDTGFVRLGASAERLSEGSRVMFTVQDSGPGIPPDTLPHIFDPFVQGGPGAAQRFGGTGLGLGIARQIVEMQGGSLTVVSVSGEGTCFTVRLPLAEAPAGAAPAAAEKSPESALNGIRLLYVEDVASNREVMEALLDGTGAILVSADTGEAGLDIVRSSAPLDAALLDLQLPDMTGFEVARRLQQFRPGLPMLAVTAQALPGTAGECTAAGMCGIVSKPIDRSRLIAAIAKQVRRATGSQPVDVETISAPPAAEPSSSLSDEQPDIGHLIAEFEGEPERCRRILHTMSQEFRSHAAELSRAFAAGDKEALRKLRHRLTTALASLRLNALRTTLDSLVSGDGNAPDAAAAARYMQEISSLLEAEASRSIE